MPPNLEHYRVFCEVFKQGSFSAAAEVMFVTQPAVSQTVRILEEELGVTLFVRGAKGISPTREGEIMFGHASAALSQIQAGEKKVEAMRRLEIGELRIGAGDTITRYFLLPLLKRFKEQNPGIRLSLTNGVTEQLIGTLKSGSCDMACLSPPVDDSDIELTVLKETNDVFIAGPAFASLRGRRVSFAELSGCPLIMLETASNTRRRTDGFLFGKGTELAPDIELGSHDLLVDFARAGFGISLVTREYVPAEAWESGLFEIETEASFPSWPLSAARYVGLPETMLAKRFLTFLRDEV